MASFRNGDGPYIDGGNVISWVVVKGVLCGPRHGFMRRPAVEASKPAMEERPRHDG